MNGLPFSDLLARLEEELHRLQYTPQSIKYYHRIWKQIQEFAQKEGRWAFDEDLGLRFLDQSCHFSELEQAGKLTQSVINLLRVVRMLGDFQRHGSILRRYYRHKELLLNSQLKATLKAFSTYCHDQSFSVVTQNHYRKIAEKFLSFLESKQVVDCATITAKHLSDYINTLLGYSYKTVEMHLCALRCWLRFLYQNQLHGHDLSGSLPSIRVRKQNRIPSVWPPDQVTRLLEAIDRGNPAGKRDYAMLLLVVRFGLRSMDIKHLKLENFQWRENRLRVIQSKTSQELDLPLLPEVGWAVIDYLRNGRPQVDSPYLFLRHLAPIAPFSDDNHLHQVIAKYLRLAKIPLAPAKKRGMHALRHTLASRLLEKETPLPVISDILGHACSDATAAYLKVDIERLRQCALNPEEVIRP
jgi:site-specific recombinase XerD